VKEDLGRLLGRPQEISVPPGVKKERRAEDARSEAVDLPALFAAFGGPRPPQFIIRQIQPHDPERAIAVRGPPRWAASGESREGEDLPGRRPPSHRPGPRLNLGGPATLVSKGQLPRCAASFAQFRDEAGHNAWQHAGGPRRPESWGVGHGPGRGWEVKQTASVPLGKKNRVAMRLARILGPSSDSGPASLSSDHPDG